MYTERYRGYVIRIKTISNYDDDFDKRIVGEVFDMPGVIANVFVDTGSRRFYKEMTSANEDNIVEAQEDTMEALKGHIDHNLK